ncbi:IS3 family transposase [Cupriavidus pauculus]|uniref:IS3 family transposase n=1 Tax=Cupriavidus pauculus TaxID=82633 RepID=UPI0035B54F36
MYRYTEQFRLSVIKEYLTGHAGAGALAKRYGIDEGTVRRWVAAYRLHGQASLKRRYKTYSAEFKLSVLERMRRQGLSHREVAALFDIRGSGAIGVWERQYDAGGLEALTPRPRGRRPSKMPQRTPKTKPSRSSGDLTRTREELLEELDYLRMENAYPKKARRLGSSEQDICATQKAQIVLELRQQYPLAGLLRVAGLARSTFYYQQAVLQAHDKYTELKARIRELFARHMGRYGYRRITAVIRQTGTIVNHKTVQRLMREMGLKSLVRPKKYRSYKGTVGRVAPNVLQRQFQARRPNRKWVTDVTEFNVAGEKLYLSPVLDLYNGEIIAYETARRPTFEMVSNMLKKAFRRLSPKDRPLLHSDQGWQYQMPAYQRMLKQRRIRPSMSRKGNCLDNATMESFFGTLKSEFFYLNKFASVEELQQGLRQYIHYYNHDRIKLKLKGLSPVKYRTQPSLA